jgi:hypothetical protein
MDMLIPYALVASLVFLFSMFLGYSFRTPTTGSEKRVLAVVSLVISLAVTGYFLFFFRLPGG